MAEQIYADIQTLEPSAYVELYEIDARNIGGDQAFFHPHRQSESIWWQGVEYLPYPVEVEGFGMSSEGDQPTPTITVADADRRITQLCELYNDLVKARFIRRRTLVRFLDAANFEGGNPEADPNEHFPDERYRIQQLSELQPGRFAKFQLRSSLSLDGAVIPSRQIVANVCQWLVIGGYRGGYCGYTGTNYFDKDDNPVADPALDRCAGRLSSCKKRFGEHAELPFGSFPAASLVRS